MLVKHIKFTNPVLVPKFSSRFAANKHQSTKILITVLVKLKENLGNTYYSRYVYLMLPKTGLQTNILIKMFNMILNLECHFFIKN